MIPEKNDILLKGVGNIQGWKLVEIFNYRYFLTKLL